jgi:hypothetical protein
MSLRSLLQETTNIGARESRSSMEVDRYFGVRGTIPRFRALLTLGLLVMWALVAYGAVVAWRTGRFRAGHVFALGLALYVLLVSAGPEARYNSDRFRVAVYPILALYVALGIVSLVRYLRARRSRLLAPSGGE